MHGKAGRMTPFRFPVSGRLGCAWIRLQTDCISGWKRIARHPSRVLDCRCDAEADGGSGVPGNVRSVMLRLILVAVRGDGQGGAAGRCSSRW